VLATLSIRPLRPESEDWSAFLNLLTLADLPTPALACGARFYAVEDEVDFIGFGGLEGTAPDQLLRSVVTVPGLRHRGLGHKVVGRLVDQASRDGAQRLWLLTTEADRFFADLGWTAVERAKAPQTVRTSLLYQDLCPATARLMLRSLS
jgi:arsenate reductase/amino-acid N-acetyltransferase